MDLNETTCLISYCNSDEENSSGFFYLVPFYDITTHEGKIILPWLISHNVTNLSGTVRFSFRFYILDANDKYIYSLNTIDAKSKVLPSLDIIGQSSEEDMPAGTIEDLYNEINLLRKQIGVTWTIID